MSNTQNYISTKSAQEPFLIERSEGYFEYQLPISIKGVVISGETVLLVGNNRGEMELPGGKLELGETPVQCVEREIEEETGLPSKAQALAHAWVYPITPSRHVFVLAYGVSIQASAASTLTVSEEVGRAEWIALDTLDEVNMPDDYRLAIRSWLDARKRI